VANPFLFIPTKNGAGVDNRDITIAFRKLEEWGNSLPAGISEITSTDATVTITNPTGPVVNLSAPGSGGGVPYASLTGPGFTTTPGDLTQAGGFTVNGASGDAVDLTAGNILLLQGGATSLTSAGITLGAGSNNAITVTGFAVNILQGPSSASTTSGINLSATGPMAVGSSSNSVLLGVQSYAANPAAVIQLEGGQVLIYGDRLSFFDDGPVNPSVVKQTVTGSRGGNAALTSLIHALGDAGYNLINDSSTA
jgi:hypothetical protein